MPLTSSIIFTRFLPMSWMSPCTAPMTTTPFLSAVPEADHQGLQDVETGVEGLGGDHQLGDVALPLFVEAAHLGHAGRQALHDGLLRVDAGCHRGVGRCDGGVLVAVHDRLLELLEDRGFVCHLVSLLRYAQ